MKPFKITLCALIGLTSLSASAQIYLRDSRSEQPIPYAQILNASGTNIATTDVDGRLPDDLGETAISIQHIAYHPVTFTAEQLQEGKDLYLTPMEYGLQDATVTETRKEYILLRTYFRDYAHNDTCMITFTDGYIDFLINLKKKKTTRQILSVVVRRNRQSVEGETGGKNLLLGSKMTLPHLEEQPLLERLTEKGWSYEPGRASSYLSRDASSAKASKKVSVIDGKLVCGVVQTDTVAGTLRVQKDLIASGESAGSSMMGLSLRWEDFNETENYRYRGEDHTSYMDLISRQMHLRQYMRVGSGPEVMGEGTSELFVLESRYLTAEEAKAYTSTADDVEALAERVPQVVTPLSEVLNRELQENMVVVKEK
jgi:hypothetical protein